MPKPTEPDKIPITSPAQLRLEFDSLHTALALEETEHTWEKIDKAVKRFQAVVRGGAGKKELADEYVRGMRDKTLVNGLIRSLATERTRLSGSTLDLVGSSTRLGPQFAPLLPLYLPTLLRLLCRTNKLYITRSTTTIISIVKNTKLVDVLRFIVSEWHGESGKSATFREKAAEITAYILSSGAGGEMQIEKDILDRRIEELEWIIKTAAVDRDAKVRAEAKKCWEVYRREWPERVASFTSPMTPTIRRYLNVNATATTASTTANSNATRAPASVKKPRVPSALSSSVSHAPSHPVSVSAPAPVRPVAALGRSAGPASRPLASTISHRAPPPPSIAPSSEAQHRSTTSHSTGMGPPPIRPARAESTRSVSNPSTSRPASRNDDQRKELGSSTTSHSSTRAPSAASSSVSTTTSNSSSFRPTPAIRSGTTSAPPFKPAVRTATKSTATTGCVAAEPRRARRIAQEPVPVSVPPVSAPLPSSTSTATLSRSTSSTAVRTQALASSTSSSRPHPPVAPSASAPFRPHKPTVSTLTSKTSTRTQPSTSTRTGPISRPPLTASTAASAARATEKPAASTLGTRSRREKERIEQDGEKTKEKERRAAAAEVAALEAAANKRKEQEAHEKEAEERKLREMAEKAKEVPLPIEEEVQSESESEAEEEEEEHEEAFAFVESQESVAEEVGMESEYLIESQGVEVVSKQEEEEDVRLRHQSDSEEIAEVEVEEEENGKIELPSEESENNNEVSSEGALASQEEREQEGAVPQESESEQIQAEDHPESPIVEEIRLVGDLPPSPFLAEKHDTAPSCDAESVQDPCEQKEDAAEISDSTVSTIAPSTIHAAQASPSPLPDVSVALDTLATAIATEANETSLLADTTLPRSPFLETAPSAQSFSASTPVSADSLDECFPTPVQQPIFTSLPPLSPEPCQTASIVLETPPRFDDPPAQLRLPGRPVVALNFPGRAPVPTQSVQSIETEAESPRPELAPEEETIESNEESEEDEEEESDTASPSRRPSNLNRRAMPPPTPLRSVPRQRQPVFLPEEASYTDNDTSFEEQEETDEESYQVPLNDAEYDDSDRGEVEVEGDQEVDIEEKEEEDQSTPKAHTEFDLDVSSEPEVEEAVKLIEPAGLTQEVDELEDEEESRFELEQPELRFHDETESEPEVTMEESTQSRESQEEEEEEKEKEEEEEEILEQQPNILKRSLRSRTVTVDLQSSSAKTPGRNRSREVLGEVQ
ncbi:hypothetical protein JCM5350_002730 [Sporobolomyces pararoseus]